MSSTPEQLLEILSRVGSGKHLGGGDVPQASLQSDIGLLLALSLIEPDSVCTYRLTKIGAQVLRAAGERRTRDQRRP